MRKELYYSIEGVLIYLTVSQNRVIGTLSQISEENSPKIRQSTMHRKYDSYLFYVSRRTTLPFHPNKKSETPSSSQKTALPGSVKLSITACLVCGQELIFHELLVKNTTPKIWWILNITSPEEFKFD